MKFLVDTNILSEPAKPRPSPLVEKWISDHQSDFYTSSLVMAELLNGLEMLPESGRKRRLAAQIEKSHHHKPLNARDLSPYTDYIFIRIGFFEVHNG